MTSPRPAVSVVICSYNGSATLGGTLDAVFAQDLQGEAFEVIVVDDGSGDATAAVASRWPVRLVRNAQNLGLAASRNVGVMAAVAPLVAFTDDDCLPGPVWLRSAVDGFRTDDVVGVGGPVLPAATDGWVLDYTDARDPLAPLESGLLTNPGLASRLALYVKGLGAVGSRDLTERELYSLVGANMVFRRDAIAAVGGFDPEFRFGGEEEDFCKRLLAAMPDKTLRFAPEAVMHHVFVDDFRDTLRRSRAYGVGKSRAVTHDSDVRPVLYPVPLGLVALAVLLPKRRKLAGVVALPQVAYFGWLGLGLRRRSARYWLFPYLQLAEESASLLGQVEGLWQYRSQLRDRISARASRERSP